MGRDENDHNLWTAEFFEEEPDEPKTPEVKYGTSKSPPRTVEDIKEEIRAYKSYIEGIEGWIAKLEMEIIKTRGGIGRIIRAVMRRRSIEDNQESIEFHERCIEKDKERIERARQDLETAKFEAKWQSKVHVVYGENPPMQS
jgi:predicted RNase H-like nuclease (RuvC/YqgF family)